MRHHPTAEQCRQVAATLDRGATDIRLNMKADSVQSIPNCGTIACHGGAYLCGQRGYVPADDSPLIEDGIWGWESGALAIARALGFDCQYALEAWAEDHPEIWGNKWGGYMFLRRRAFERQGRRLTLDDIVTHWERVADRIAAMEKNA